MNIWYKRNLHGLLLLFALNGSRNSFLNRKVFTFHVQTNEWEREKQKVLFDAKKKKLLETFSMTIPPKKIKAINVDSLSLMLSKHDKLRIKSSKVQTLFKD